MGNRLTTLGVVLAAILTAVSCAPAGAVLDDSHYSVGISGTQLHWFRVDALGNGTSDELYNFGNADLSDVATSADGQYVFVSNQKTGAESLYVLQLSGGGSGAPSAKLVNTVSLSGMAHPTIAVTSTGHQVYQVYVVDRGRTDFAYIATSDDWTTTSKLPGAFAESSLSDVAAYANGDSAVVARWTEGRDETLWPSRSTQATNIVGGLPGLTTAEANTDVNGMANSASAVATHKFASGEEYAYVINDGLLDEPAALSVFNALGPARGNTYLFPVGVTPETNDLTGTITAFTFDNADYLSIVGTDQGMEQAWLLQINADGTLPVDIDGNLIIFKSYSFNDLPNDHGSHRLAASWDGKILWVGSSSGSVLALDSGSFAPGGDYFGRIATDPIRGIADLYVPEPSSLAALFSLGLGAIGFVRFRRRRTP